MSRQLSLPAGWARGFGLVSQEDPADQLRRMERDRLDAKTTIRLALDELATKHGVRSSDVTAAMGSIDDVLADLLYEVRSELDEEIERRDQI